MAQYVAYVNYVVAYLDDNGYDSAVGIIGGNVFDKNPVYIANLLGITFPFPGGPITGPFIYGPGDQPTPPELATNVDFVIVPGKPGNPASIWPAGPDTKYVWSGTIIKLGGGPSTGIGNNPASNPTLAAVPQRRFGGGFELGETQGMPNTAISRDASRTVDGLGFAIRNNANVFWNQALNTYDGTISTGDSWERFYLRLRVLPSALCQIHKTNELSASGSGMAIRITTTGAIAVYDKFNDPSPSGGTLKATSAVLQLNRWYKIDLIVNYNTASSGGTGRGRVWINGVNICDYSVGNNTGLGTNNSKHQSSSLGSPDMGAFTGEYDLDDWHNADIPKISAVEALTSVDWFGGTHWKKTWNTAFGDQHSVNWTGQFEAMNSMMSPDALLAATRLTSSTSVARMDGVTDVNNTQDAIGTKLGVVAAIISKRGTIASGASGQLGYRLANGASVLTNITENSSAIYNSVMYRPTLGIVPDDVVPFHVIHDKAASAVLDTVYGMQASVQYAGVFGPEDDSANADIPTEPIYHNAYYPNTLYAYTGPAPDAPMAVIGGTYVGNGTITNVNLPLPAHFIFIRALTGSYSGGVKWWSADLGAHDSVNPTIIPNELVRAWVDSTGQAKFTVVGTGQFCNASGVTYQYIAFCDPGMRYMINAPFRHNSSVTSFANPIVDSTFLPECVFALAGIINTVGAGDAIGYKGPGHTGTAGTVLNGNNMTNFGSFATGVVTSGSTWHNFAGTSQFAYSAIRSNDGAGVMAQIMSYTGNGAGGTRNITLTPTSGRFPLFALVIPSNAQAIFRDPSHTGSNSNTASTDTTSTTGIVGGGIDQLQVGVTLNANGIVYNVFVIPGDVNGWNNGTFYPPNNKAPGNQWPHNPATLADINAIGAGGLVLSGSPATSLLLNISGIYSVIPGQRHDVLLDRQSGQTSVNVPIPNPFAKTGFVGG